ncbi:MAG TPA: tRNA 2-thiouridine(34) synthase MnmA [Candidatus Binatia bacterium]|nr:tRNA 2-thiouridine(34) synthase MnmA [Candidatus Binatia bacterium]
MSQKTKVVVAMSGGVDSSVAAALLVQQGYDVHGVSLRMWEGTAGPRVCSDHRGAEAVAARLKIPYALIDLRERFAEIVVQPFAADYLRGRTPNPCVACNRDFKLGSLLNWAKEQGADYVATGHYARIARAGRMFSLSRGADRGKDQSYFLFALSQQQLANTLFPLGGMQKTEVRELARRIELPTAERAESQDVCFGDYKTLVASHASEKQISGGDIVGISGKVLGRHDGIHGVTIGQRRGLGISAGAPLYVVGIDEPFNRIVVGQKKDLSCAGLIARSVNWLDGDADELLEAQVQIRYRAPAVPCVIRREPDGNVEVRFKEPLPAVTPGQAAVFYEGERLLGGGWIAKAIKSSH